jgi:hypothetical protein
MPTSSKYIQLSSSVLMEYVYADQSAINDPGNPYRLSTTSVPIWLMQNDHTKVPQVMNADSEEFIQNGIAEGTGNVRNRTFAKIKEYEGALLDIDKILIYNDYDPLLTNTTALPLTFVNPQAPVYDTIKLHLVQGFNFENNDGLILSIDILRKDNKLINLLSWVYNKSDTWETLNPSPFFFGGRVYDSYIEVRVLSLYNLIYDYWLNTLTNDSVVLKISNDLGVAKEQSIQVKFSWVKKSKTIDEQEYITFYDGISVDLPTKDQFESVSAIIQESTGGDYIEFYASHAGKIIENFILDLNSSGYDFILLHDLTVSEYVWDGSSTYNWVVTDELQISQTNNYDLPNLFRPIIKNPSAIAYKIDYIVRLYNRNDNSQIWKAGSMISNSAAKYGRRLLSINLGENPIQSKIYNQRVVKDITINRITEPVLDNTKYITSFLTNSAISISYDTINEIEAASTEAEQTAGRVSLQGSASSNSQLYPNGLGRIVIPNNTSYLKFTVYQKDGRRGANTSVNLSGIGDFVLSFTTNTGESIDIQEFPTQFISKTKGELVFRITQNEAKDIIGFTNKTFNLFLKNDKGEETFLYSGKFFSVEEYQNIEELDQVTKYQRQIATLNDSLLLSQQMVAQQQTTITDLLNQNQSLASDDAADSLKISNLSTTIESLNSEISRLSRELALSVAASQKAVGLPVTTQPVQNVMATSNTTEQAKVNVSQRPSSTTTISRDGRATTSLTYQEYLLKPNIAKILTDRGVNFLMFKGSTGYTQIR